MDEKLFSDFIAQLVSQAPQFIKSMKYAKIMLTVLTKYSVHVSRKCMVIVIIKQND